LTVSQGTAFHCFAWLHLIECVKETIRERRIVEVFEIPQADRNIASLVAPSWNHSAASLMQAETKVSALPEITLQDSLSLG